MIEAEDKRRGDGSGIGPTLVRLAWHASGTYSKVRRAGTTHTVQPGQCKQLRCDCCRDMSQQFDKTGGSNGATMRFVPESTWGANAGLTIARRLLEPIKAKYPGLTYADLWTFAGKVRTPPESLGRGEGGRLTRPCSVSNSVQVAVEEAGGPIIPWKPGTPHAAGGH